MQCTKRILLLSIACTIGFLRFEDYYNAAEAPEETLLVIGILSAPNNSAARFSIRQTWKSLTTESNIKFYFLVGINICPIHPVDRKSEFTCETLKLINSTSGQPFIGSFWVPNFVHFNEHGSKPIATSFTFRVNFPVIVHGVRIWIKAVPKSSPVHINLKNARTGKLLTSVLMPTLSSNRSTWHEVRTEPFLLPKAFDGELQFTADGQSLQSCFGISSWISFNGAIEFTSLYEPNRGWVTFDKESCTPVSLLLELYGLPNHLQGVERRNLQWQEQVASLSKNIRIEANAERDILFLEVVDVYHHIPQKLMQFYKWAFENLNFAYLLKADDDTFINVPVIVKHLNSLLLEEKPILNSSRMWWWGNLRHGLPVERHGKWQELAYAAPVYPPFPCGAGYVLNRNIIEYLVSNSRWLHHFQGEDTSLGIWLSGIHPKTPKEGACYWSCGQECDKLLCNRAQLSIDDMVSVWQIYQRSQKLC